MKLLLPVIIAISGIAMVIGTDMRDASKIYADSTTIVTSSNYSLTTGQPDLKPDFQNQIPTCLSTVNLSTSASLSPTVPIPTTPSSNTESSSQHVIAIGNVSADYSLDTYNLVLECDCKVSGVYTDGYLTNIKIVNSMGESMTKELNSLFRYIRSFDTYDAMLFYSNSQSISFTVDLLEYMLLYWDYPYEYIQR